QMVSGGEFFQALSRLAAPEIELGRFRFSEDSFSTEGVTSDMKYLNQLNSQLKETSLFKKFYVSEIDRRNDFVFFTVEGQVQKGE
ncbi:MAG: hypothetical protein R6V17_02250, partial [Halanaerobacter sp.]